MIKRTSISYWAVWEYSREKSFTVWRIWVWALQIMFPNRFIRQYKLNYLQYQPKLESLELLHFGARFQEKDRRQKMTRSASHFCFVVFPPQGLLDVLESRVMKRTSISYWAVWEYSRAKSFTVRRIWVWALQNMFPNRYIRQYKLNYLQYQPKLERLELLRFWAWFQEKDRRQKWLASRVVFLFI